MKSVLLISIFWSLSAHAFTLGAPNLKGYDRDEITYDYDNSGCPINITIALGDAIDLWNSVETTRIKMNLGTSVSVTPAQATSTLYANPVVVCDTAFAGASGLAALGGFASVNSKIVYGYIVINANNATSSYFGNLSEELRAIAVAHEMGHSLGLGHTSDKAALMYFDGSLKTKLNLSQDDVDGMTYLYPRDELSGDLLGCGMIKNLPPSNTHYLYLIILLFLPLGLALGLKGRDQSLLT